MTAYVLDKPGRSAADELVAAMREWEPPGGFGGQMHVGDLGWFLRFDDETVADGLHVWRSPDGSAAAVGVMDSPGFMLTGIARGLVHDPALGAAMAETALSVLHGEDVYFDAPYPAAVRMLLAGEGWELDDDPWPALYLPLSRDDLPEADPQVVSVESEEHVSARVAVQQAMFERSLSDTAAWHRMRQTPAYSSALDLLLVDDGVPVAAATAWSAGAGRCGLLEPVGVHRDHRGKGYGARVVRAACAALAAAGASGVGVFTPGSNTAAVGLYRATGFRSVGLVGSMRRRSS